jgi:hypothetical protein
MHPTIRDGEVVLVRPLRKDDLRPGAILLYPETGRLGLHRMIRRSRPAGRVFLAADAAPRGGRWVAEPDLLGVAESVQHGDRVRRLDGPASRLTGLTRYAARPLLRIWLYFRPTDHANTPSCAG